MFVMQNNSYKICRFVKIFFLVFLFSGLSVYAQLEKMGASELLEEANLLLQADQYDEATPYLETYLSKFGETTDARVVAMAQDVRFKLGSIMVFQEQAEAAAPLFQDYVNHRPAPKWHEAMKLLSTSLLELGNYPTCRTISIEALAGPTNEIKATFRVQHEEEENEGYEHEKDDYEFDEYGDLVEKEEGAGTELDPSGYIRADLVILNMNLGEACVGLDLSEECIAPFLYVAEFSTDGIRKGYAIMKAIDAMISLEKFDDLTQLIPQLYRTDARYDIRVNLALMNAASSLFEIKKYDEALPLYRMILPREELINYQKKRVRELQFEAGIITAADLTDDEKVEIGVKETLFGKNYGVVEEEFWHERGEGPDVEKPRELIELEELIETLLSLPPYELDVRYRNANLYDEVNRFWEAFRLFDDLFIEAPDDPISQQAFYEASRLLFDHLEGGAEAEKRCFDYLDQYKEDLTPRQVAYLLTGYYQKSDQMPAIKSLIPYLEGFTPSPRAIVLKYECELYYMQAVADMVMLNYELAETAFMKVLVDYPGSHQEDNATYWHAMTLMFQQKYEEALPEFEAYLEKFPNGDRVASAAFQSGTCLFGMEKYDRASVRFTQVIEQHPGSRPYPDACSMRGDIYGSEGRLDEAVDDYKQAIQAANSAMDKEPARAGKQAAYATFQMAAVFEAEDRYPEIIEVVEAYMDQYGEKADIAKGIFWIGKTRINQGRVDEAIQSYLNAIVQYGTDLKQDGVDSMIAELVVVAHQRLQEQGRTKLKADLIDLLDDSTDLTLQLRLRATIATLDRKEIEFGKRLITELPDLSAAAPPVLAAICAASFELKDYSRAAEILKVFQAQFDDSEFIRPVFKLRAFDLYEAGKLDEAMVIINEAQGRYGTDYDVAWAQLMKGDIHLQQGQLDEARKDLLAVLNVIGWRGAAYAEATYRLGQVEDAAGDPRQAFGWYQRAYFQYKGYAEGYWAAEGYLASANCLKKMGLTNDVRNTYRAMLLDKYVNTLSQAEVARNVLGAEEVLELAEILSTGIKTNLTVTLDVEDGE